MYWKLNPQIHMLRVTTGEGLGKWLGGEEVTKMEY
jgi:hypothetical protein